MKGVGKRLRALRGGLTQAETAKALGLGLSAYTMYESDNREPKFETLLAIADHYGVSTDYLLGRTECRSPDVEIQAVVEKTGLTNETIDILMELKREEVIRDPVGDTTLPNWASEKTGFFHTVNKLLQWPVLWDVIMLAEHIEDYHNAQKAGTLKGIKETYFDVLDQLPEELHYLVLHPVDRTFYAYQRIESTALALVKDLCDTNERSTVQLSIPKNVPQFEEIVYKFMEELELLEEEYNEKDQ